MTMLLEEELISRIHETRSKLNDIQLMICVLKVWYREASGKERIESSSMTVLETPLKLTKNNRKGQ